MRVCEGGTERALSRRPCGLWRVGSGDAPPCFPSGRSRFGTVGCCLLCVRDYSISA